jgi:hypothetical protein
MIGVVIPIRRRYHYSSRGHFLYAIGERDVIIQACKAVFGDLGMATEQKDGSLTCYPGGLTDRFNSAMTRFGSYGLSKHLYSADYMTISYTATDNPAVTLLRVQYY